MEVPTYYRGQPRRHLLTTGWSIFVSQKKIVFGDAVLFLRGEDGELRLGIRRAKRPRLGLPQSVLVNQDSYSKILSSVANAVSTKSTFHVFYSTRASHADFVIPYSRYCESISNKISIGKRFYTRFDMDDTPESGTVIGVSDLNPFRWPNSKWRCLKVKKMCRNDPDATQMLKECEKAVKKLKSREAISAPVFDKQSVSAGRMSFNSVLVGTATSVVLAAVLVAGNIL